MRRVTVKQIAASIMCADQFHLAEELRQLEAAGIELLHCDVMDGIYVNNLALGPEYLKALHLETSIPLDIHLATVTPLKYIDMFQVARPEYISFHVEAADDVMEVISKIKSYKIKPSIAINPETPVEAIFPYLDYVNMVLVMTVNPGFAGQEFRQDVITKIAILKEKIKDNPYAPLIEVDGNINSHTVSLMRDSLPDVFVLGTSALFHQKDNYDYAARSLKIWSEID